MSTSPTSPKNHQGNRSFRNSSGSESKDQRVSAVEMSPSPSIVDAIANTTIDARKKKKLYFILDISIGGKSKQIAQLKIYEDTTKEDIDEFAESYGLDETRKRRLHEAVKYNLKVHQDKVEQEKYGKHQFSVVQEDAVAEAFSEKE